MKKIYWRPRSISRTALLLISLLSIGGLLFVEYTRRKVEQPYYKEKIEAARLASECIEAVRARRIELGHPVDLAVDPADTGLIGGAMTSATSISGVLTAKQTSANPNFAAVVVELLKKAGVQEGDTVAVAYSGSFPALNLCVEAACETLKLKPLGISSTAASQWGANLPDLLWIDMEHLLCDKDLIHFRSVAASLGGVEDRGLGLTETTLETLRQGVQRNDLRLIEGDNFTESVDKRMDIYKEKAKGARIRCYINVGGGTTSVGKSLGKKKLHAGLNFRLPPKARNIDSVTTRFLTGGVPVIHLVRINDLATRYGLPIQPQKFPELGDGGVFSRQEYNNWYAALVLAGILFCLNAFIRSDWGFRIFQLSARSKDAGHPEPMI
jgi:poly-gamma-glutamate system protein